MIICRVYIAKFRSHEADEPAAKENEKDNKDILAKARMLLSGALHQDYASVSDKFRTEILDKMRYDNMSKYVRTDSLILKYGSTLHRRHGSNRCHDNSQKMRLLSRLVLTTREGAENGEDSSSTLESLISGRGFDAVIEATETLCQLDDDELGRSLFKNPSHALHIGHVLVKCAEIKKAWTFEIIFQQRLRMQMPFWLCTKLNGPVAFHHLLWPHSNTEGTTILM
jgi:hypothetical protein